MSGVSLYSPYNLKPLEFKGGHGARCQKNNNLQENPEFIKFKASQESKIMGHEMAHKSATGQFGGSIVINRDENDVAIGGSVPISIPRLDPGNPESSLAAYQTILFAALAPGGDLSSADKGVAKMASVLMGQAEKLIAEKGSQEKNRPGQRFNRFA